MRHYFVDNNTENLLIFFTGWGCDESEFEHLESSSDVLLLYNYSDLDINFNFSKYKKIDLIAFSAGVFVASIINLDIEINKKIAISGNPYLFDEKLGLCKNIQNTLCNINENNADDFAKNYLIKTDEEWKNFHHSKRTIDSCKSEFENLKNLYAANKQNIKDIYNMAIIGDEDPIFKVSTQEEYYKERLHIIKNARHNLFFRIKKYEQLTSFN